MSERSKRAGLALVRCGPRRSGEAGRRGYLGLSREAGGKRLKLVVLGEWEEYVGWLEGVEEGPEGWVAVFERAAVALPSKTDGLDLRRFVGKRVGILRTDDGARPVRVRAISGSEGW